MKSVQGFQSPLFGEFLGEGGYSIPNVVFFLRAYCTRHTPFAVVKCKSFYLSHVASNSWVALQGRELKRSPRDRHSGFQVSLRTLRSQEGSAEVTGAVPCQLKEEGSDLLPPKITDSEEPSPNLKTV